MGTWCTPELVKAEEMGYVIQTTHEVWHFGDASRTVRRLCEHLAQIENKSFRLVRMVQHGGKETPLHDSVSRERRYRARI